MRWRPYARRIVAKSGMKMDPSAGLSARYGHGRCLVCGEHRSASLHLSFTPREDGSVHADFVARHHLQGYDDLMHGGVIATVLDAAMTHCLFHRGVAAVTADLRVRYVRPVVCGSCLNIDARILKVRLPLYHLRAEIACNGLVGAWAEAKFLPKPAVGQVSDDGEASGAASGAPPLRNGEGGNPNSAGPASSSRNSHGRNLRHDPPA